MTKSQRSDLARQIESVLLSPVPPAAELLAASLTVKYPGAAVFLYGSGISVSADENPADILFDFYVIAPDYSAIRNPIERIAAHALPPNVYYFEQQTSFGLLRAKYAVLSIRAFERLVSEKTFHSYFWARFAQPMRIAAAPPEIRGRMVGGVITAITTFLRRSAAIAGDQKDWRAVWLAGLNASYRAELRAEASDRAAKLIEAYGAWPRIAAEIALDPAVGKSSGGDAAWRLRAILGAALSVARLLKATTTFKGGIDYIAWKIKRHAGVDVGVKPWERRHPFIAAPIVAARYYRLRSAARRSASA